MSNTDSGWRKRQSALDKKAENARELGLDYEPDKTIMRMAREAGIIHPENVSATLEAFAALIRADEAEKYKWDIHSCGPTCKRYACVAMREAVIAEREACAKVCDDAPEPDGADLAQRIRNRGQA
jgi:hypothetical protein